MAENSELFNPLSPENERNDFIYSIIFLLNPSNCNGELLC